MAWSMAWGNDGEGSLDLRLRSGPRSVESFYPPQSLQRPMGEPPSEDSAQPPALESREVSRVLQTLGLSTYEAKAYVALVELGYGNADTIADAAQIPRTSAYKVLQMLCEKGFAISTKGRPMIFKPERPEEVKRKVVSRIGEVFESLQTRHEILMDKGEPQVVYTIWGKQRVMRKIGELLDTASSTFIIATPTMAEIRVELARKMDGALKRKVDLVVITEPMQRVPEGCRVVWKKGLLATDIIADGERALIAAPDLNACGYTDNASLARHLESFLHILMEQAPRPGG